MLGPCRAIASVAMLGHRFQLVRGPVGDRVDIAVLISHEIEFGGIDRDRLRADPEETTYIDDDLAAVQMGNGTDLLIAGAVDCGSFEHVRDKFVGSQPDMITVIHRASPLGWAQLNT